MASLDVTTDIDVLPIFVIGYAGARRDLRSAPPWVHVIQHQYAGLGCQQFEVTGCVLPLAANQREGTGKLWLLTRALVELGESWPGDAVYDANEVAELVGEVSELTGFGRGERAMNANEVEAMAQLLARHLACPGLAPPVAESGHEALIQFRDVDPLPFFDGWRVMRIARCEPDGEPVWLECARYHRELERELQELVLSPDVRNDKGRDAIVIPASTVLRWALACTTEERRGASRRHWCWRAHGFWRYDRQPASTKPPVT